MGVSVQPYPGGASHPIEGVPTLQRPTAFHIFQLLKIKGHNQPAPWTAQDGLSVACCHSGLRGFASIFPSDLLKRLPAAAFSFQKLEKKWHYRL